MYGQVSWRKAIAAVAFVVACLFGSAFLVAELGLQGSAAETRITFLALGVATLGSLLLMRARPVRVMVGVGVFGAVAWASAWLWPTPHNSNPVALVALYITLMGYIAWATAGR